MLRDKYSVEQWVFAKTHVKAGDTIAFYCPERKHEVQGTVLGFPKAKCDNLICYQEKDKNVADVVDFFETIVYCVGEADVSSVGQKCSCGAKYTSNPSFHLVYCDLG
jgi:hypothetical protein